VSLCNTKLKPGFICHKKKPGVNYTIMNISKKAVMKVLSKLGITSVMYRQNFAILLVLRVDA